MKYFTITTEMVGKSWVKIPHECNCDFCYMDSRSIQLDCPGRVLSVDVGKRVYPSKDGRTTSVENQQQFDARIVQEELAKIEERRVQVAQAKTVIARGKDYTHMDLETAAKIVRQSQANAEVKSYNKRLKKELDNTHREEDPNER